MTLRGSLSALARLAFLAALVYAIVPSRVAWLLVDDNLSPEIAQSRTSAAFVLGGRDWISFGIPEGQSLIKLVSNANVPEGVYSIHNLLCEYTLRYQLLGGEEELLREQELVLRSGPLNYRDDESSAILPAQTYLGLSVVPLSSRTSIINVEGLESSVRRLRVGLVQADSRVKNAILRVYLNQKPSGFKLRYLWQRLAIEKRERLARANVHGVELLTDAEKENLLLNRWVAVAPQGIEGRDYEEWKLYTLRERDSTVPSSAILPRGVLAGPGVAATIPIPEEAGCVRLELQAILGAATPPELFLAWHRRGGARPVASVVRLAEGSMSWSAEYDAGLLEVESPEDIVVRAYIEGSPAAIEITPEAKCAQCFQVRPGFPVEFSILNPEGSQGAFRVDVRRLALEGAARANHGPRLRYHLLDETGSVLGTGQLDLEAPDSWYDRPAGAGRDAAVSEPVRSYFCLPARCASFRVSAEDEGACLAAYTRPFALVRTVKVPEDYQAFEKAQDDARTWFPLIPRNYAECVAGECEAFVRVAQRPPASLAGRLEVGYHVQDLAPDGAVDAIKVITPADLEGEEAKSLTPAYFAKIERGLPVEYFLGDASGEALVSPRMICLRTDDSPFSLTVLVDGRAHFQMAQASRSNETILPPVSSGWHEVSFEGPAGAGVYLNGILVAAAGLHLERFAYPLGPDGLTFRVQKETSVKETLTLRLLQPTGATGETALNVSIRGAGKLQGIPTDSWTFPETLYSVRAPAVEGIPVAGGDIGPLSLGEPFLMTLGSDLGPGPYEVALKLERGPRCFVTATHLIPGKQQKRRIFNAPNWTAGGMNHE